jgi:hypothetical protein
MDNLPDVSENLWDQSKIDKSEQNIQLLVNKYGMIDCMDIVSEFKNLKKESSNSLEFYQYFSICDCYCVRDVIQYILDNNFKSAYELNFRKLHADIKDLKYYKKILRPNHFELIPRTLQRIKMYTALKKFIWPKIDHEIRLSIFNDMTVQ